MQDLNQTQIEHLQKFNDELVNGISKDDVISLENFVGKPVITVKHNINKFTSVRSETMVDTVKEDITSVLKENPLEVDNNYSDLLELMFTSRNKLNRILKYLEMFMSVDRELIDLFMNEKFMHTYSRDNELINITAMENLFTVIAYRRDYLQSVLSAYSNSDETSVKLFVNDLNNRSEELNKQDETIILSLLNVIFKNQICSAYNDINFSSGDNLILDNLTIKDMYDFWQSNIPATIKSIKSIIKNIEYDLRDTRDFPDNYTISTHNSFRTFFKKYKNFNGLLSDPISIFLLETFSRLKYITTEDS